MALRSTNNYKHRILTSPIRRISKAASTVSGRSIPPPPYPNMDNNSEHATTATEETPQNLDAVNAAVATEVGGEAELSATTEVQTETETVAESEMKAVSTANDANEEVKSNVSKEEEEKEDPSTISTQPQQKSKEEKKDEPCRIDDHPPQQSTSKDDAGLFLAFQDFIDLQTRLVLVPYIEEEGKGATVAAYPEDDRFEGLVLVSVNDEENGLPTRDFTDILAGLRDSPTPIRLKFVEKDEKESDEEKDAMIDVDLEGNGIHEEKKDDETRAKPNDPANREDPKVETPRASNHDRTLDITNSKSGEIEPKHLFPQPETAQVQSSSLSPNRTYLEKRQSTPSKEHTKSLNSVLDDHREGHSDSKGSTASATLSSGMFALSAWGMRMKAKSEKLLATAGAKTASAQETAQASNETPTSPLPHCDMYLQTNVGAYFPISKASAKTGMPQHLQAVTTSSLYCIRKSPTEPCVVGRNTTHRKTTVRYSFQWYRSSSKMTSSRRDRFSIPHSTLYDTENFDNDSIGDSTLTSKRSRTDSSADSVSSSYSSWSSSSNYSSSSSYSMSASTAGVTPHTFSLASVTSATNTTNTRTTKETNRESSTIWIPLKGATGATFQPNITLVGKKLRCIVTIRRVRENSSDEEDESIQRKQEHPISSLSSNKNNHEKASSASPSSKHSSNAGASMDADDKDDGINAYDDSVLEHDNDVAQNKSVNSLLDEEEDEVVERIICDLAIPIQADMVLFNGAKQAMTTRGSANFGNLLGRGEGKNANNATPATATSACGKTFRIEVATTRKTVLYTPPAPASAPSSVTTASKRSVNVNSVKIFCRASPQDEYVQLTDVPLFQVSASASPTNSKHVDLLFPSIPPLPTNGAKKKETFDEKAKLSTHRFLSDYCVADQPSCPRLELEVPNRMTRESILLALGIANFRGKAIQLDNKKVLYRDDDEPILQVQKRHREQHKREPSNATVGSLDTPPYSNSQPYTDVGSSQPIPDLQSPHQQLLVEPTSTTVKKESVGDSVLGTNSGKNEMQPLSAHLSLSPSHPSGVVGGSENILSPISCQSNLEGNPQCLEPTSGVPPSMAEIPPMPSMVEEVNSVRAKEQKMNSARIKKLEVDSARVKELEREMEVLRAQLTRKDKTVTALQRQVQASEAAHQKTKQALNDTHRDLKQYQEDCERIQMSKRHVERSMQSQLEATQKIEMDHGDVVKGFEGQLQKQADKITELEKLNRALQNEKAVLGATVEARESKLVKLEELQASNNELSEKIARQGALESQLEQSHRKHERLQKDLEDRKEAETKSRTELEAARSTVEKLQNRIKGEQEKASSCLKQLDTLQTKNQLFKAERNSYRQKNESLSKEVSRLCKGGKNIRDIEKILADHESLLQEAELLRIQKRKALEDAQKYRISYEQAKAAEELLAEKKPDERETLRILERTAELERLLTEMTEYVGAKQMQLDTMKAVNEELQKEIHSLALANRRPDEV